MPLAKLKKKTSHLTILEDEIPGGERMLINEKFQKLSRKINQYKWKVQSRTMTPVELLYVVGSKCQMTLDNKIEPAKLENGGAGFACELFIDCILFTTGSGAKKRTAKENACQKAIDILSSSSLSIVENESGNLKVLNTDMSSIPESSPDIVCVKPVVKAHTKSESEMTMKTNSSVTIISLSSFASETGSQPKGIKQGRLSHGQQRKRKRVEEETCSDLSQFILIYQEEAHILSKLQRIADFNKVKLDYRSEETDSGWQCETYFGSFKMANGIGKNEKEARINSAEKALIALKEVCWSLKEKQCADTDEAAMTKDDLPDLQVGGAALPDTNIGNMLLRKMGWTGGGVGKEGNKGIAEPIQVAQVVNRQGLGLKTAKATPKQFYSKLEQFVTNYIKSDNQDDVVFSPHFTKRERAVIHKICSKFKLRAISRGLGYERYLTVGRKRTAQQLFDYVMSKGGSTQKYEVIPPSAQSV